MTSSTGPATDGDSLPAAPAGVPAPKPTAPASTAPPPAAAARQPAPAPQIPDPAAAVAPPPGGPAVTDTGTLIFPQPAKPARPGFRNLATVPPMGSLTVPPLENGGEAVVIDVYGTEVDEATAERAYAAAQTAGFSLREL
jgi:hypothetical protein